MKGMFASHTYPHLTFVNALDACPVAKGTVSVDLVGIS